MKRLLNSKSIYHHRNLYKLFFQNEEMNWTNSNHPCMNRIQLQPHTSTENILVSLVGVDDS